MTALMSVDNISNSANNGPVNFPFGVTGITSSANISANDSNVVFTSASNNYQVCNPTAARTYTMPSTLIVGTPWVFYNQATSWVNCITLQTSGSNIITIVPPLGYVVIMPLTSTPTTAANWSLQDRHSQPVAYTPSGYGGFGTMTAVQIYAQLLNSTTCFISFLGQAGTTTASLGVIPIPAALTISTTGAASVTTGGTCPIVGTLLPAGTYSVCYAMICSATSTSNVYFGTFAGPSNASGQFGSTEPLSGFWSVPVN